MDFVLAADVRTLPLVIFGIVLAITLGITYLGLEPHEDGDRLLGRRPRNLARAERLGHRRRLHVGRRVPRRIGADVPLRESTAERSFHELRVRSETGMGTDTAVTRPA